MTIIWRIIILVLSVASCVALLLNTYPWSTYYENFTFGFGITFASYAVVASLVGIVVAVVLFLPVHKKLTPSASAVLTAISVFAGLTFIAVLFGPGAAEIPHTRVNGIFFSEWRFMTFISSVALPVCIVSGGLMWMERLIQKRRPARIGTPGV